jgi:hypothetical protein
VKRTLAVSIQTAALVVASWAIGASIRGPFADDDFVSDLVVGLTVVGSAVALEWSARELEKTS